MTYPVPPNELVDFNTGRNVPDYDIGRQFAEQARSIRAIISFIETCFRSDGRLKNSTIGPEQLDPEIAGNLGERALSAVSALLAKVESLAHEAITARIDAQRAAARVEAMTERIARIEEASRLRGEEVLHRLDEREAFELNAAPQAFAAVSAAAPVSAESATPWVANMTVLDGSAYGAEQWAEVSMQWAEHLPDTIPPNILATNAITGEHWSSRWWAIRAANAYGMLAWTYCGASNVPPAQTLTGDPLTPGCLYFDTNTNTMQVWNGSGWQPFTVPQKAYTATLYYLAADGQQFFNLTTPDLFNNFFAINSQDPEGVEVYVNGARLTQDNNPGMITGDFFVNIMTSTVTLARPLPAGAMVAIDVLQTSSQLAPGAVAIFSLNNINTPPGTQDGAQTAFALTLKLDGTSPNLAGAEELLVSLDGVIQEPGVQYTASADQIVFAQPPAADAYVFISWYKTPLNNP